MSEECTKSSCSGCPSAGNCSQQKTDFREPMNAYSNVKHVFGIISGKGGVGKSAVTSQLAVKLSRMGYKVGILDADITGPSIPKMFGITEKAMGNEENLFPVTTPGGIKVISVNLILPNEDDPVVWRGPIIGGVVKQFWSQVVWGEIDYLLVDMPPGTGDVALTVFQSLPLDGVVIVSSPQSLVEMIVKKAYKMALMMSIPVIGLVQNMSYLVCSHCGEKTYIYGKGKGAETAKELNIPAYSELAIRPEIAALCDAGAIEKCDAEGLDEIVEIVTSL
ncbi:MAG: Mrp/NBP35 family ATP-binding protein [Lachnospiraceae bacterium]|nr:Mrp/NBP35 family ATP-binding protein [Lachnospiraceae bacterium]